MANEALPNPSLRAVDDLALVRRVVDRSPEAMAELHDRYAPLLLGVARRIVGDAFEAEEVLHETFLQAWSQAPRFDAGRSSVSAWLVLAARARALDRARARVGAVWEPGSKSVEPVGGAEGGGAQAVRRRRVRAALEALAGDERQVLELAFWQGLSPREIAARTGAPLETVQARTLLALRRLRQALRDEIRELM